MKILIVTSSFPHFDNQGNVYGTLFLYRYIRELIKNENEVEVIHFTRKYPAIFNCIASILDKIGVDKYKGYIVPSNVSKTADYIYDGIPIHRIRYSKIVPHGFISRKNARFYSKRILKLLQEDNFHPDVIIGDLVDCSLPIFEYIKKKIKCKYGIILHNSDFAYLRKTRAHKLFTNINFWLIRSATMKKELEKYIGTPAAIYPIYSGIEEDRAKNEPEFRNEIKKIVFVGRILKTKGIGTLLGSLKMLPEDIDIKLTIVGSGDAEAFFKEEVLRLGIKDKVKFVGGVKREEVFDFMKDADMLVMVSKETFGMVYIEAMACGCIPVGAYGCGIDGIIENGKNGFLSHIDDTAELCSVISRAARMKPSEIGSISKKAYETACSMTDEFLTNELQENLNKIIQEP